MGRNVRAQSCRKNERKTMTTRNEITGDELRSRTSTEKYRDNYDKIFGKKDQKVKQQDLTELNGDGNRDRGRNGEDLTNNG